MRKENKLVEIKEILGIGLERVGLAQHTVSFNETVHFPLSTRTFFVFVYRNNAFERTKQTHDSEAPPSFVCLRKPYLPFLFSSSPCKSFFQSCIVGREP